MQHVRVDHDPQRQLLQVHQLRHDIRLRVTGFLVTTEGRAGKAGPNSPPSFDRLRAAARRAAVAALVAAPAADHDRPARAARRRVLLVLNRRE